MGLRPSSRRPATPTWPLPSAEPPATPATPATPMRAHPRLRRGRLLRFALVVAVALAAMLGAALWRLGATATNYPGAHFNHGRNGVWLEHTWAGDPHSDAEYEQLAQRLRAEQIGFVFVHVGPLASDGTIAPALAGNAGTFAAQMHQRVPGLHVLAWIGQLEAASGSPADQVVNLGDSAVRGRIAATAARFVGLGMDGVHYDIEPILNNNPRFLDLLDETRQALPVGATISVAAEKWAPNAHLAAWAYNAGRAGAWWTSYYYATVAAHADQLVVLGYNTAMPTAGAYQLLLKQETQHILEAVDTAQHPPRVLIGIPTYAGDGTWFHASAENMRSGLQGVTAGLNSGGDWAQFDGVAIYRFGTTAAADWSAYDHLWLGL